ncbi:MAG: hypothetical protein ACLFVR_14825 [Thiohalospira sp.]
MKTLKNLFRNENNEKSISNFSNALNFNTLLMIKGGTEPDMDLWPPTDFDDDDDDDETQN